MLIAFSDIFEALEPVDFLFDFFLLSLSKEEGGVFLQGVEGLDASGFFRATVFALAAGV